MYFSRSENKKISVNTLFVFYSAAFLIKSNSHFKIDFGVPIQITKCVFHECVSVLCIFCLVEWENFLWKIPKYAMTNPCFYVEWTHTSHSVNSNGFSTKPKHQLTNLFWFVLGMLRCTSTIYSGFRINTNRSEFCASICIWFYMCVCSCMMKPETLKWIEFSNSTVTLFVQNELNSCEMTACTPTGSHETKNNCLWQCVNDKVEKKNVFNIGSCIIYKCVKLFYWRT